MRLSNADIRDSAVALPLPGPGNHTGALTYYDPGMGACGYTSSANQSVLAIGHATFDAVPNGGNPNRSPLCGKQIRISRVSQNGSAASVTATVVDRCACSYLCIQSQADNTRRRRV